MTPLTDPMMRPPIRIAMWSGPRNISTAMMRAWENRPDATVVDEPLYAFFLAHTGLAHPGAEEIVARYPTDWRAVVDFLCGPVPEGKPIWYQKHMTHHVLPEVEMGWLDALTNCFLIREPEEMIASYIKVRPDPTLADFGLIEQRRIFDYVRRTTGRIPPVLDARLVLENPEHMLSLLCDRIGVPFHRNMLAWPAGRRATDGIWAPHWYAAVEQSTGFQPYRPRATRLPGHLRPLLDACNEYYAEMAAHRLE
jgi:hypothetical protein